MNSPFQTNAAPTHNPFKSLIELESELPKNPEYEKSFVAFLDILGFKEFLIRSGVHAPQLMTEVYKAFRFARNASYQFNLIEHRMFSDSVMIWCAHRNPHSFWNFLNQVELVRETFFRHGLLVRGGITYGDHFSASEVVVSNALVQAYKLEQAAVFPRIRVDETVLDLPDMRVQPKSSGAFIVPHNGTALMVSPGKIRADCERETCLCPFRHQPNIRFLLTGNTEIRVPEDAEYTPEQLDSFHNDGLRQLQTYRESLLEHRRKLPQPFDTAVQIKINYLEREFNLTVLQCNLSQAEKAALKI